MSGLTRHPDQVFQSRRTTRTCSTSPTGSLENAALNCGYTKFRDEEAVDHILAGIYYPDHGAACVDPGGIGSLLKAQKSEKNCTLCSRL